MRLPRIDKASATSSWELTVTTVPLINTVSAVGVDPMNSACAMKDPLLSKSKSSYHEIRRVCQGEILIHLRRRTSSVPDNTAETGFKCCSIRCNLTVDLL